MIKVTRRRLLAAAGVAAIATTYPLGWKIADHVTPLPEFEPITDPAGFRRVAGGSSSLGETPSRGWKGRRTKPRICRSRKWATAFAPRSTARTHWRRKRCPWPRFPISTAPIVEFRPRNWPGWKNDWETRSESHGTSCRCSARHRCLPPGRGHRLPVPPHLEPAAIGDVVRAPQKLDPGEGHIEPGDRDFGARRDKDDLFAFPRALSDHSDHRHREPGMRQHHAMRRAREIAPPAQRFVQGDVHEPDPERPFPECRQKQPYRDQD